MSERLVEQILDVPAIVGEFLQGVVLEDLFIELIQNELDAGSTATTITFHHDRLTCEGNGRCIQSEEEWERLRRVMGAGGLVAAKADGIGAKNHGLRTGFLLGDSIEVQSDGQRIDLTVVGDPTQRVFYPATIQRISDATAPPRGTRITIPYRTQSLHVPSAEGFTLYPPESGDIERLCRTAVDEAPRRLIGAGPIGSKSAYKLELRSQGINAILEFRCAPVRTIQLSGLWLRTCRRLETGNVWRTLLREMASTFQVHLAQGDDSKVAWPFRQGRRIVGEIGWQIDGRGRPVPTTGQLRYPITYPEGASDAFTGHGFHISAPFISDAPRHGIAVGASRNASLVNQARTGFVSVLRRHLLPAYGASVMNLLRATERPDYSAERALLRQAGEKGALPAEQSGRLGKRGYPTVFATFSDPVIVASFSDAPAVIAPELFRFTKDRRRLLADRTPAFVVEGLLEDGRVTHHITEADAVDTLLAADQEHTRDRLDKPISVDRFNEVTAALSIVQRCVDSNSLTAELQRALVDRGMLPTQSRGEAPWRQVTFSRDAVPAIDGVQAPIVLDLRLTKLSMFQRGSLNSLKLSVYRLDDYLAKLNFEPASPAARERFFTWLAAHERRLKPATLAKLAKQPVWPTTTGGHLPLGQFCRPASRALRSLVDCIVPKPSPSVLAFPRMQKVGRGVLALRRVPSPDELRAWHELKWSELLAEPDGSVRQRELLIEIEQGLDVIWKDRSLSEHLSTIAENHKTLTVSLTLQPAECLHIPTRTVEACRLLPDEIVAGRYHGLYEALGAEQTPTAEALRRALLQDPQAGGVLYRRLEEFVQRDREPKRLADERIIPMNSETEKPGRLTLQGNIDYWGDWKRTFAVKDPAPRQLDVLVAVGVVRQNLTEGLSREFFEWLSRQRADVQQRHLPQIMRHWRDPNRGPRKWWGLFPQIRCLPVRGHQGSFSLASRSSATGVGTNIYLPDFPEINEQLLERDSRRWLVVTDVEGVSGTLFGPLRASGVPSLRTQVGRPVKLATSGEFEPARSELKEMLALISSEAMLAQLEKRLDLHGVAASCLRPNWRSGMRALSDVRIVPDITATYVLGAREYQVAVSSAVDSKSGFVWVKRTSDYALAVYEALAEHFLSQEAGPHAAYGLMKAVEQPFTSIGRVDNNTAVGPEPNADAEPGPGEVRTGHGLRDEDLQPVTPSPTGFKPVPALPNVDEGPSNPFKGRRIRPRASTTPLRLNTGELEHIRQLKQDHYVWHCQACLGSYDVLDVVPPESYLTLQKHRRENIEAHHVDHLQNRGVQGASNLLLLCHYHHDLLGDRLTRAQVLSALRKSRPITRHFPLDREGATSMSLAGEIAVVTVDAAPFEVPLFFTEEHSSAWRKASHGVK